MATSITTRDREWSNLLGKFAEKWSEVPATRLERVSSKQLLQLSDEDFLRFWDRTWREQHEGLSGLKFDGWLHIVYDDFVRGRKIIEVGPGIGIDTVAFAKAGAEITVVDIVKENLEVVKRVFRLRNLKASRFVHMTDLSQVDEMEQDFDAIIAIGSLINAPAEFMKPEFQALGRRLKPGGRFITHNYPKQRWIDEGSMPFDQWGEQTDGPGTPWVEWYDAEKVLSQLSPSRYEVVMDFEYLDGAMNCIDLIKIEGCPQYDEDLLFKGLRSTPISLDELKSYDNWNGAYVTHRSDGTANVVTVAPCWGYSAVLPLPERYSGGEDFVVKIATDSVTGRVGIGLLTEGLETYIVEQYVSDSRRNLYIRFARADRPAALLVRNAHPKNKPSSVDIIGVEVLSLE